MRRASRPLREQNSNPTPAEGKPARRGSGFTSKPSARLNPNRQADPWSSSASGSNFKHVYQNGGIPARIDHGGVKHRLHWDTPPEELPYDPLLIHFADGLAERQHPFVFVSQRGFAEMLAAEGAAEKTLPVVGGVVLALRKALLVRDEAVFRGALLALRQLSEVVGPALNPHLKAILAQVGKKALDRRLADDITETLQTLDANGGPEVLRMIKAKVPTYAPA